MRICTKVECFEWAGGSLKSQKWDKKVSAQHGFNFSATGKLQCSSENIYDRESADERLHARFNL